MLTAHQIELNPEADQVGYFCRACGTTRFTWNWALAEWNRQYANGQKPSALALKKQFNAIKYAQFPWLKDIHRDAHAQPFAHLARAWSRFFDAIKLKQEAHAPVFKRKGQCLDSFYVANDKLAMEEHRVRLPVIGWVRLKEPLRFGGRIMGASVTRQASRWFLSVQVETAISWLPAKERRERLGLDLNVNGIVCSNGKTMATPRPMKVMARRIRKQQKSISRKMEAAKVEIGLKPNQRIPKGTKLPVSKNREKATRALADLHYRVRSVRHDFLHKLTTKIARENQAVIIEGLNVKGMTQSSRGTMDKPGKRVRQKAGLNRAILDVGFGEFRRQLAYKSERYACELTVADRWYPSSKRCSCCGSIHQVLTLKDRAWTCNVCGTAHDRDFNAAVNLEMYPDFINVPGEAAGEVTSVRHETARKGTRGRKLYREEETGAPIAHF